MLRMIGRTTPLFVVLAVLLGVTDEAHARRGIPLFIQTGADAAEIDDVPEENRHLLPHPEAKAGYVYEHFAIFWITVWTWGGDYAVYRKMGDIEVWPATREQMAMLLGKSVEDVHPPFAYRWPFLIRIVGILGIGFVALVGFGAIVSAGENKKFAKLKEDPVYRKAMKILEKKVGEPAGTGHLSERRIRKCAASAGKYLLSEGIDKPEAKKNMTFIANQMYPEQREEPEHPDD